MALVCRLRRKIPLEAAWRSIERRNWKTIEKIPSPTRSNLQRKEQTVWSPTRNSQHGAVPEDGKQPTLVESASLAQPDASAEHSSRAKPRQLADSTKRERRCADVSVTLLDFICAPRQYLAIQSSSPDQSCKSFHIPAVKGLLFTISIVPRHRYA
jgi:hypothetical protein